MSHFKIGGAVIVPLLLLGPASAQSISFDAGTPSGNKGDMTASGRWSIPIGSELNRVRYHIKATGQSGDDLIQTTTTGVLSGTWQSGGVTYPNGTYTYWADVVYTNVNGTFQASTPKVDITITNSIVPGGKVMKAKRRRYLPVD